MLARFGQTYQRKAGAAFTLAEVTVCMAIFVLVTAGIIYGYTQSNSIAEWSAMSLAAQSDAAGGVEQARSATCSLSAGYQLPATNYVQTNTMQVPITGQLFIVTNQVNITTVSNLPYTVWLIQADCYWKFPPTGKWFTNAVITERAPNQ
jgi:type II secretory pathway pseudopilin PulG